MLTTPASCLQETPEGRAAPVLLPPQLPALEQAGVGAQPPAWCVYSRARQRRSDLDTRMGMHVGMRAWVGEGMGRGMSDLAPRDPPPLSAVLRPSVPPPPPSPPPSPPPALMPPRVASPAPPSSLPSPPPASLPYRRRDRWVPRQAHPPPRRRRAGAALSRARVKWSASASASASGSPSDPTRPPNGVGRRVWPVAPPARPPPPLPLPLHRADRSPTPAGRGRPLARSWPPCLASRRSDRPAWSVPCRLATAASRPVLAANRSPLSVPCCCHGRLERLVCRHAVQHGGAPTAEEVALPAGRTAAVEALAVAESGAASVA